MPLPLEMSPWALKGEAEGDAAGDGAVGTEGDGIGTDLTPAGTGGATAVLAVQRTFWKNNCSFSDPEPPIREIHTSPR